MGRSVSVMIISSLSFSWIVVSRFILDVIQKSLQRYSVRRLILRPHTLSKAQNFCYLELTHCFNVWQGFQLPSCCGVLYVKTKTIRYNELPIPRLRQCRGSQIIRQNVYWPLILGMAYRCILTIFRVWWWERMLMKEHCHINSHHSSK